MPIGFRVLRCNQQLILYEVLLLLSSIIYLFVQSTSLSIMFIKLSQFLTMLCYMGCDRLTFFNISSLFPKYFCMKKFETLIITLNYSYSLTCDNYLPQISVTGGYLAGRFKYTHIFYGFIQAVIMLMVLRMYTVNLVSPVQGS